MSLITSMKGARLLNKETSMANRLILQSIFGVGLLAIVFSIASSAQAPAGTYIKGVVASSSNKPLRSVWVILGQDGREIRRALTGDDGKYYISNLRNGVFDITVISGTSQLYKGQVRLPENSNYNITIKSTPSPTIRSRAVRPRAI